MHGLVSSAEDFDHWASGVQAIIAAVAVIAGAVWAYFRFVKDRVYRPRLDLDVQARWARFEVGRVLLTAIAVKNIGSTKVRLIHRGTGLVLKSGQPNPAPYQDFDWTDLGVTFTIFEEHDWIESGETIRHETVSVVPEEAPGALLLELNLVCRRLARKNITVYTRKVVGREEVDEVGLLDKLLKKDSDKTMEVKQKEEDEKTTLSTESGKKQPK